VCHRLHSGEEAGQGKGAPRSWELKGLQRPSPRCSNKRLHCGRGNSLGSCYLTGLISKPHPLTSHVPALTFFLYQLISLLRAIDSLPKINGTRQPTG